MSERLNEAAAELFRTMHLKQNATSIVPELDASDPLHEELVTWAYGYLMQERSLLSTRLKALAAVAMLTVLKDYRMLRQWIEGALNLGCSQEEIKETIITMSIYGGVPIINPALAVANEVFASDRGDVSARGESNHGIG